MNDPNKNMTLIEKIKNIKKTSILKPLKTDSAKDFNELWKKVIEPNLPEEQCVIKWHEKNIEKLLRKCAFFNAYFLFTLPSFNVNRIVRSVGIILL